MSPSASASSVEAGNALERAVAEHRRSVGEPEVVARAPGRVNLIGEHTDYNEGFVLPMALPFDTAIAVSREPGAGDCEVVSEGYGSALIDSDPQVAPDDDWAIHIRGVDRLLRRDGIALPRWRATIATDVPTGASLSSSASLEVATALALIELGGTRWRPAEIARLGQRVENEIVGLASGIMDQLISATAVADHASLIDCRSLESTDHPLPAGAAIAVMDTMTRRELVDSEYDDRRDTCHRAAALLGLSALRDATLEDLDRLEAGSVEHRRARHVIAENSRTLHAAEAMQAGDAEAVGRLMNESHTSLRDDYEVSGDALDAIVAIAQASPGCHGARMTGGGFAGCAVALIDADHSLDFSARVRADYRSARGIEPTIWICRAGAGAALVTGP